MDDIKMTPKRHKKNIIIVEKKLQKGNSRKVIPEEKITEIYNYSI